MIHVDPGIDRALPDSCTLVRQTAGVSQVDESDTSALLETNADGRGCLHGHAASPPAHRCWTSFATNGAGSRRSWTGRWIVRAQQNSQRRDFSSHPRRRSQTAARTSAATSSFRLGSRRMTPGMSCELTAPKVPLFTACRTMCRCPLPMSLVLQRTPTTSQTMTSVPPLVLLREDRRVGQPRAKGRGASGIT